MPIGWLLVLIDAGNPTHTFFVFCFFLRLQVVSAAMTIAFAYQGQSIFPEIQSEMLVPEDMPKSVVGSACMVDSSLIFTVCSRICISRRYATPHTPLKVIH